MSGFLSFRAMREVSRFPGTLLGICLTLIGISLLVIHSASVRPDGTANPFVLRQVIWACAGLTVFGVLAHIPYPRIGRRSLVLFLLGIGALAAVFVIGTTVNGAKRWISVGPIRLQPSEFMKYVLVIVLARTIAGAGPRIRTWRGLAEISAVTAIPFLMVLTQPDLGTALTYLPILVTMVFVAGARLRHLAAVAGVGLGSLPVALPLAWAFVLKDYQKLRILAFLDSSGHSLGGAYQTTQSMIAIGSGGLFGRGYMQGTQGPLGFLPERHTDFIFAVICEDFGLVGGVVVLGLYGYLIATLARIARSSRDVEGRLLVTGVTTILTTQVAVNVGMALGVTPVTGLTLPLVSYGGSSLVAAMAGFGLAASVARSRVVAFTPE